MKPFIATTQGVCVPHVELRDGARFEIKSPTEIVLRPKEQMELHTGIEINPACKGWNKHTIEYHPGHAVSLQDLKMSNNDHGFIGRGPVSFTIINKSKETKVVRQGAIIAVCYVRRRLHDWEYPEAM